MKEEEKEVIKRKARKELLAEQTAAESKEIKKRSVWVIVLRLVCAAVLLFVIFETVMGVLDMQRLNEDKEPLWYIDSSEEVTDEAKITRYNLGLYVIDKTEDSKETKIILKPFFIK